MSHDIFPFENQNLNVLFIIKQTNKNNSPSTTCLHYSIQMEGRNFAYDFDFFQKKIVMLLFLKIQ